MARTLLWSDESDFNRSARLDCFPLTCCDFYVLRTCLKLFLRIGVLLYPAQEVMASFGGGGLNIPVAMLNLLWTAIDLS